MAADTSRDVVIGNCMVLNPKFFTKSDRLVEKNATLATAAAGGGEEGKRGGEERRVDSSKMDAFLMRFLSEQYAVKSIQRIFNNFRITLKSPRSPFFANTSRINNLVCLSAAHRS